MPLARTRPVKPIRLSRRSQNHEIIVALKRSSRARLTGGVKDTACASFCVIFYRPHAREAI